MEWIIITPTGSEMSLDDVLIESEISGVLPTQVLYKIHTYIHTYISYIHTYISYIHTYIHTYISYIHTYGGVLPTQV